MALFGNFSNVSLIEESYEKYKKNPDSVDSSWRHFFEGFEFASSLPKEAAGGKVRSLIDAYRVYGHLLASFNPLQITPKPDVKELQLSQFGFTESDLTQEFPTEGLLNKERASLKEILEALKNTYANKIGFEYKFLCSPELEEWLQKKIEPFSKVILDAKAKRMVLDMLNRSELLESFLHTKYVGQTRFSLEGGETMMPLLKMIIETGGALGVSEMILGMAHRGRLNVLSNLLGKSYTHIFAEFEGIYDPSSIEGSGDVKYHKGYVSEITTESGKKITFSLTPNPSHLEAVNPVVEGQVRAKQDATGRGKEIIPILIHGDSSMAGQGVMYETMQLSRIKGYTTLGTIHIVVNNQIGFTTLPKDYRSTRYCTDIAKAFGAPIFHVNAEDPESCVEIARLSVELRQKFGCDVFIDLNCYRKYGHNEGDEPLFTQPIEYQLIKSKKPIRELYRDQLIQEGVIEKEIATRLEEEFKAGLQQAHKEVKEIAKAEKESKPIAPIKTAVPISQIQKLAQKFCTLPEGLQVHPKAKKVIEERLKMVQGDPAVPTIDWGMGEHLAFATLLVDKVAVRLSGQDVQRGTFSQRHSVLIDQKNDSTYFPLSHLEEGQAPFMVYNSPLSEYGVMGFDFGYSISHPRAVVIWEAQYGDFVNGAQLVIDQFIAPSETKWGLNSNLVLMLPHGYEGAGPEHSSARIERFLQLCGEDNMQVTNPSTPAQLFHLLRRQANILKPLIIFTPKALLRNPLCQSALSDFSEGTFKEIIDDSMKNPKKLYLCSGKVYYDLYQEREKRKREDIALVRLEQFYPLPEASLRALFSKYPYEVTWVQEEHANMGAWDYLRPLLQELAKREVRYIGRERSASTSAGYSALHKKQQAALLEAAFA